MSRSHNTRRKQPSVELDYCGRGTRRDREIVIARRDLKPENVLSAVVDDDHVRIEVFDYDANSDVYDDGAALDTELDDLWAMTREAPSLRVRLLDVARIR